MRNRNDNDRNAKIVIISIAAVLILVSVCCLVFADLMSSNLASIAGGVLSAIATFALGLLAFWQNKRYKDLADAKNDQIEKLMLTPDCIPLNARYGSSIAPPSQRQYLDVVVSHSGENKLCLVNLISTNQPMVHVCVNSVKYYEDNQPDTFSEYMRGYFASTNHEIVFLSSFSEFSIQIQIPEKYAALTAICEIKLYYSNAYGRKFQKTIQIKLIPRRTDGYEIWHERAIICPSLQARLIEED